MQRIITVPSMRSGEPSATLTIESDDGETATMTLASGGAALAAGENFWRAEADTQTWLDCGEHEAATTFAAFLELALTSSEPDARVGWALGDEGAAADWLDALRLAHRQPSTVTIIVDGVDVDLLRRQRDALLTIDAVAAPPEIGGLVTMLDHMLDIAEGFTPS